MTYPMRISPCTSTIETAVYVNRTHGGVRGRELVTPSYSIRLAPWAIDLMRRYSWRGYFSTFPY